MEVVNRQRKGRQRHFRVCDAHGIPRKLASSDTDLVRLAEVIVGIQPAAAWQCRLDKTRGLDLSGAAGGDRTHDPWLRRPTAIWLPTRMNTTTP